MKKRMEVSANILAMFFNHKMTTSDALSEIIDNAFGPAAGNATAITIEFFRNYVRISDNGVGVRDLNAMFTPGVSISKYDEDDIGSYGIGGKFGYFHFGKHITVTTVRNGELRKHSVDFAEAEKTGLWPYEYDGEPLHYSGELPSGTSIMIKNLHRGRHKPSFDFICDTLAHRYLLATRAGKKIIVRWLDKERILAGQDIIEMFEQDVREFNGEINGKPFTVTAGDTKNYSPNLNGLWIGYGFKFIRREKSLNNEGLPSRFYGRVVLGKQWKRSLDPFKTDIVEDKDETLAKVYELLADWIALLRKCAEELRTEHINTKLSALLDNVIRITGEGKDFSDDGLLGKRRRGKHPPGPHPGPHPDPGPDPSPRPNPDGDKAGLEKKKNITGVKFSWEPLGIATPCRVISESGGLKCVLNTDLPPIELARQAPFKLNVIWPILSMAIASLCRTEHQWATKLFPKIYEQIDTNSSEGLQGLYDRIAAHLINVQPDARPFAEDVERDAA